MAEDLLSTIRREVDERLSELRPLLEEHQRLLEAADALERSKSAQEPVTAASAAPARRSASAREAAPEQEPPVPVAERSKRQRAARGAAREAILGALEHGSHTVPELVVVTAMGTANINGNLRRLVADGVVQKTEREGKTAWARVAVDA